MRRNKTNADDIDRIYATDLFTTQAVKTIANHDKNVPMYLQLNHLAPHAANSDFPMQAPVDVIEKFSYIESEKRRTLAGLNGNYYLLLVEMKAISLSNDRGVGQRSRCCR